MTERSRADVFGEVAPLYDRARPTYPAEAIDLIVGAVDAPRRAVEAGAGTGKATQLLAARGVEVLAVEPDARMVEVLAETTRGLPVTIVNTPFEDAELPTGFDLGVAAQAWHWVEPERGAAQMAHAIRPGGALALMWNTSGANDSPLWKEIHATYDIHAPHMADSVLNKRPAADERSRTPLLEPGRFARPEKTIVPWVRRYSTAEYADLLHTHSDHRLLAPDVLDRLVEAITAIIEDNGGSVDYAYETDAWLLERV
ncbi:MAG TPA: class I SAM-dependent methyltransferase [Acidimicrobiia bacterium]